MNMKFDQEHIDELIEASWDQASVPNDLAGKAINRYRQTMRVERRNNWLAVAAMLTLICLNGAFLLTQFQQKNSLAKKETTETGELLQIYNSYFTYTNPNYGHEQ